MEFNQTKDIKTCIPEPFIVESETDYAQLAAVDTDCEAFFVENLNSSHLPLGLSNFLPLLKIYLFKESNLIEIHQDSLKDLTNLVEVSFYKNSLTKVAAGIFRDNKLLRKISFGANKIKSIDADTFKGLKELREIYLNDNELEVLDAELFRDNQQLFVIDLELNKLKMLPMTIFHGLSNLNSLNLNNNNLEALPGRIFNENVSLKILTFYFNQIIKTDIQDMVFFESLDTIDVLENTCTSKLRYIPEISELKEIFDKNCKVEWEDKYKWLLKENEEITKSYARVLQELKKCEELKPAPNEDEKVTVIPIED